VTLYIIQHRRSGMYLGEGDEWVDDFKDGVLFGTHDEAVAVAHGLGVPQIDVVVREYEHRND